MTIFASRKRITATIFAGLVLMVCPTHALAAEPVPVFSFLGQDTDTPTTMTAIMGTACTHAGDETKCQSYGGELGGVKLKYIVMKYHQGKLYNMYGAIWDHGLGDMLAAFSARYGQPVAEKRRWQNKRGSTFDNPTFIWKFRCGDLELESLGWDLNSSSFGFSCPANMPPPDKPVVDF